MTNHKNGDEILEYLAGDEETKRLAYLREKAIRDEQAAIAGATRRGRIEGIQTNKIETAKKMLAKNVDIDFISEITGLTKEEIENIKKICKNNNLNKSNL